MLELVSFNELSIKLGGVDGLSGTVLADQPHLELIVESVYSALENYTQRIFEQDTYTKVFYTQEFQGNSCQVDLMTDVNSLYRYSNTVMIGVDALPIVNITSVVNENSDDVQYKEKSYGILAVPLIANKVTITYTGGYLQAEIPSQLKRAALYQIQSEWLRRDHPDSEYVSADGGYVTRPEFGLLSETKKLLSPFRHPLSLGV